MDDMLSALSLCRKAGALAIGHDAVREAAGKGNAHLLLFARDVSPGTRKRILAAAGQCPAHTLPHTQAELATITRKPAGVLAVTNTDLAALCLKKLPFGANDCQSEPSLAKVPPEEEQD